MNPTLPWLSLCLFSTKQLPNYPEDPSRYKHHERWPERLKSSTCEFHEVHTSNTNTLTLPKEIACASANVQLIPPIWRKGQRGLPWPELDLYSSGIKSNLPLLHQLFLVFEDEELHGEEIRLWTQNPNYRREQCPMFATNAQEETAPSSLYTAFDNRLTFTSWTLPSGCSLVNQLPEITSHPSTPKPKPIITYINLREKLT